MNEEVLKVVGQDSGRMSEMEKDMSQTSMELPTLTTLTEESTQNVHHASPQVSSSSSSTEFTFSTEFTERATCP